MKKRLILGLALVAVLSLGGCMFFTGSIYGTLYTDTASSNYTHVSIGGFPSYPVPGYSYEVSPGTYDVYYTEYYGGQYYPGAYESAPYDSSWYYHYTYSVDGDFLSDQYFDLYLYYDGLYKSGTDASIKPVQEGGGVFTPGTYTWTKDGLTFTIKAEAVHLTPEEAAQLPVTTIIKK